jgi:hypothetical protein
VRMLVPSLWAQPPGVFPYSVPHPRAYPVVPANSDLIGKVELVLQASNAIRNLQILLCRRSRIYRICQGCFAHTAPRPIRLRVEMRVKAQQHIHDALGVRGHPENLAVVLFERLEPCRSVARRIAGWLWCKVRKRAVRLRISRSFGSSGQYSIPQFRHCG